MRGSWGQSATVDNHLVNGGPPERDARLRGMFDFFDEISAMHHRRCRRCDIGPNRLGDVPDLSA